MASRPQRARTVGCLRAAVGLGLIIAPRAVTRLQADQTPTGPLVLLIRTVGIRDLVIGAGTLAASRDDRAPDLRRWVGLGLLSDVLDVVAGAASVSAVGRSGALAAAAVPIPLILADVWALVSLPPRHGTPTPRI